MQMDVPDRRSPGARQSRQLIFRALRWIAPYRRRIAGVALLGLTVAALNAAQPLVMKGVFDALGSGHATIERLGTMVLALLALELARTLLEGCLSVSTWNLRLAIDYLLREQILGRLHTLPLTYYQDKSVGGTITRVNQSITGVVTAFAEVAFTLLPAVAYLVLSVVALSRLEWRLALLVLAFTPLPAIVGTWAAREQTERERTLLGRWTTLYSRLDQVLGGIRTVKAFGMEEVERRRFLSGQREGNSIVLRGVRTDAMTNALRNFAAVLARLATLAVGGWMLMRGEITLGTLVAALGYITVLFGPVQGLTNVYATMRRGTVSLEAIAAILDEPDAVADRPTAVHVERSRGHVRFDRVTFHYDGGANVLHDITLEAKPGETVAIVGPSGSGKTTLTMLLQRHYPLECGSISVDGIDVRDLSQHALRRQIGVVHQDVDLFNETVRDNIAYGLPTASDQDIERAARAAYAHQFIVQLPEGYDTVLGEHGGRLSGGQRQRLAIARAILADPPILIFDEATSALDAESEARVQAALRELTRQRTTFVIAHRLATVVSAPRIVVMDAGRIQAMGPHGQLVESCELYRRLVRSQTGDGLSANGDGLWRYELTRREMEIA